MEIANDTRKNQNKQDNPNLSPQAKNDNLI